MTAGPSGNAGEQELTDLRSLRAPRGIASRGQGGGELADGSSVGGVRVRVTTPAASGPIHSAAMRRGSDPEFQK